MRIVKWHPDERVDKPDLDAMSYLVLGEFRRTMRALVQGDESFIINGFVVETAAVPNTTIRVRLDPGTGGKGAALGGELTGVGVDYGQLIGDRDSSGINEGPAQQILDFVGQPVASYTVELRFPPYTDAVSDNRAFWNQAGLTEYVSNVETRAVGSWEVRFVAGAPTGGQWIPLATVAWDNVAVDAADITDLRALLWEGKAPFQQATQTGSGGVEDFDRSTARGGVLAQRRLRGFARSILRQIQDVKGQDDAGQFNWFSRVFSPFDPADVLGAQSKTMRTIDTVTYTVGDGVRTFGDFNGTTGLDLCLAHLVALSAANKPERVEIVVHGGAAYVITGPKVISGGLGNPITVVIRAGQTLAQGNLGLFGRPRITIDGAALAASEYGLTVSGSGLGSLVLRGLDVVWTGTTAGGRGMFAANGYIDAQDCNLQQTTSPTNPDVAAGYVLASAYAQKCNVKNCVIRGRVQFYHDPASGAVPDEREMGVIENSRLEATQIVLRAEAVAAPGIDMVNGFAIRDCYIEGRGSAIYTSSVALIDARCARKLHIERNTITYGINENAIDLRTYNGTTPFDVHVRANRFVGSASNGAAHASGAGGSGASGTGWAVSVSNALNIHIEGNRYAITDSVDAGGVRLSDVEQFSIEDESHVFCAHGAGGTDQYEGYLLTGATDGCIFGAIDRVQFSEWNTGVVRVRCMNLDLCARVSIDSSTFLGQEFNFGAAVAPSSGYGAMRIDEVQDVRVRGCVFEKWANTTANSRTIFLTATFNTLKISSCSFLDCGGFSIVRTAGTGTGLSIDDCTHRTGDGADEDFADLRSLVAPRVTNCTGIVSAGPDNIFISFDQANFLFMGNQCPNGDFDMNGAAVTGRGFNEAGQDLNLVGAYTP